MTQQEMEEREKRYLRKTLRQVNKGKISCEEYVRKRKEYKVWCEEEKKRDEKEEDTKINNIKTEADEST